MASDDEVRQAYVENLMADTAYKRQMSDWEPWKAIAVTAGATATLTLALVALAAFVLSHLK